jgi:hypothetical protein
VVGKGSFADDWFVDMNTLNKVRIWLLRLLIGNSPVMANMTVHGRVTVKGSHGYIFDNCVMDSIAVDGPVDEFTRG